MILDKIEDENEDRIIIVDSRTANKIILGTILIIFGLFILFIGTSSVYFLFYSLGVNFLPIIFIIGVIAVYLSGFFVLAGIYALLVKSKVTIDRKLQRIIIEKKWTTKYLESNRFFKNTKFRQFFTLFSNYKPQLIYFLGENLVIGWPDIKEIPFSNIKEIEMFYDFDDSSTWNWKINLITNQEKSDVIINSSESEVKWVASKISEITDKKTSYRREFVAYKDLVMQS